jgi:AcrR family transcriptional regulator
MPVSPELRAPRRRGRPAAGEPPAATDDAILGAALEAFAENGYLGTSVRELSRALGVSHNLVPQRFGTKERLWYAAVEHGFATFAEAARTEPEAGEDPFDTLRRMIVRFVEAMAQQPALLRIVNQEASRPGPRLDYLFERHIGPVSRAVQGALDALGRCGRARPVPPAAFYFLITHGVAGPLALSPLAERFGPPVSADDPAALRSYAEAVADLLIHGIADEESAPRSRQ